MVKTKKTKKTSMSMGDDIALSCMFKENFEENLKEYTSQLEKIRNEQEIKFTKYEAEYNDVLNASYIEIGKEFIKAVKLQPYFSLKEAMSNEVNRTALNKKKDYNVLIKSNKEIYFKVLSFIAEDELVSEAISNYITELMLEDKEQVEDISAEGVIASETISGEGL